MNSFQPATAAHALNTDAKNPDAITVFNTPASSELYSQCHSSEQPDQSGHQESYDSMGKRKRCPSIPCELAQQTAQ
jgi:hypothetical protein